MEGERWEDRIFYSVFFELVLIVYEYISILNNMSDKNFYSHSFNEILS